MKRLTILEGLFNILYILGIVITIILMIGYVLFVFDLNDKIEIQIQDYKDLPYHELMIKWTYLFFVCGVFLYVLIVRNFKKVISLFFKNQFFSLEVSKLFYQIGVYFIASIVLIKLPPFLFAVFSDPFVLKFEVPVGFDSLFFLVAIGLFFISLSEIFKKAISFKEDSELAI